MIEVNVGLVKLNIRRLDKMENIFKNAKFGDKFLAKDGTVLVILGLIGDNAWLHYENHLSGVNFSDNIAEFRLDGICISHGKSYLDIVKSVDDKNNVISDDKNNVISDDKLNELAWAYVNESDMPLRYEETAKEAFKSGYLKAKLV